MKTATSDFRRVLGELRSIGLLLVTDPRLPSVASLFAGEPVRGSWWTHPKAHEIFTGLGQLEDHKDVLFTKLVSGKVTLVHSKLWRDLLSIAIAREPWQTEGLPTAERFLLRAIDSEGSIRSDRFKWPKRFQSVKIGDAIRELESRLLVHTEEFHTESGAHAKLLETWEHWADRIAFKIDLRPPAESKRVFESLLTKLNDEHGAQGHLMWQGHKPTGLSRT